MADCRQAPSLAAKPGPQPPAAGTGHRLPQALLTDEMPPPAEARSGWAGPPMSLAVIAYQAPDIADR
jgi:hypothetical protein